MIRHLRKSTGGRESVVLTGSVSAGEVAALAHEVGDDAVEGGALEVQGLAGLSDALLAGAQASEVLRGARHDVVAELHHSSSSSSNRAATNDHKARGPGVVGDDAHEHVKTEKVEFLEGTQCLRDRGTEGPVSPASAHVGVHPPSCIFFKYMCFPLEGNFDAASGINGIESTTRVAMFCHAPGAKSGGLVVKGEKASLSARFGREAKLGELDILMNGCRARRS